jgi:hypothetical protein
MEVPHPAVTVILSVAAGALAWLATNLVGKPIVDARDKRLNALQVAEQNAYVGGGASDERRVAARAALGEAASALRSISRGQWPVRLYCRFARYDLEAAAAALVHLHNITGVAHFHDEARPFFRDAVYVFLRAHQHLSRERVEEINKELREFRLKGRRIGASGY